MNAGAMNAVEAAKKYASGVQVNRLPNEERGVGERSARSVEQLPLGTLIALSLGSGAIITAAFVVLAPLVEAAGFPPIAALLLAILVVLVPIELGIIFRAARDQPLGVRSVIPYRRPMAMRDWIWLVPALIVAEFAGFGLSMAVEPTVISSLFAWLPEWFVRPIDPDQIGAYSAKHGS